MVPTKAPVAGMSAREATKRNAVDAPDEALYILDPGLHQSGEVLSGPTGSAASSSAKEPRAGSAMTKRCFSSPTRPCALAEKFERLRRVGGTTPTQVASAHWLRAAATRKSAAKSSPAEAEATATKEAPVEAMTRTRRGGKGRERTENQLSSRDAARSTAVACSYSHKYATRQRRGQGKDGDDDDEDVGDAD